ncbi:MAG: glycosyl-4,4'-diaponeurosporenoate acyltransferase [Acidimicrobiales bacterium]|nr:MAG: glycosyl-4,4'-diaponeurosporenoate acyltransferase [Acidimicrobiales bacterium]
MMASKPANLSKPANIALDLVAWAMVHAATGYLAHCLPDRCYQSNSWLWRERRVEDGGRLYQRLRIQRWKPHLPEGGTILAGGFDKRHLHGWETAQLEQFVVETRRAELGHWLAVLAAPVFFAWNPVRAALVMPVYAVAANGPCIAAQRYNRIRLTRLLATRRRREKYSLDTKPTRPRSP